MYTSPRVLTTSAPVLRADSAVTRAAISARGAALVVALCAYLVFCLATNLVRRASLGLVSWLRGLLREQRRMRRLLITTAIFALAIVFGVSASGTTLALWNRSTPVGSVSVATGVDRHHGQWRDDLHGARSHDHPTSSRPFGGVSAGAHDHEHGHHGAVDRARRAGVRRSDQPARPERQSGRRAVPVDHVRPVGGWQQHAPPGRRPSSSPRAASISACLQTTLSATAPATVQGLSATFTVPLVGTQVRNNS